ncbi:hypothetical protein ISS30_01265 [bacterium]|nr:hypothetical protein [bacterium]
MKRVTFFALLLFLSLSYPLTALSQNTPNVSLSVNFQQWVQYSLADWESDPNLWTITITNADPDTAWGVMLEMHVSVNGCADPSIPNGEIGWGFTWGDTLAPGASKIYFNDNSFKDNALRTPKNQPETSGFSDAFETAVINTGSSLPAGEYSYNFRLLYDPNYRFQGYTYPQLGSAVPIPGQEEEYTIYISQPSAPELASPGIPSEAGEAIEEPIPTFQFYTCGATDSILYQLTICEKVADQTNEDAMGNIAFYQTPWIWDVNDDEVIFVLDVSNSPSLHSETPITEENFSAGEKYVWQVKAASERFMDTGAGFNSESEIYCFQYVPQIVSPTEGAQVNCAAPFFSWRVSALRNQGFLVRVAGEDDPLVENNYWEEEVYSTTMNHAPENLFMEPGKVYYWKIKALPYGDWHNEHYPPIIAFNVTAPEPAREFDLLITMPPSSTLLPQFIWESVPGADNYRLMICSTPDTNDVFYEIDDIVQTTYTYTASDERLSFGVEYFAVVKAYHEEIFIREVPKVDLFEPFTCTAPELELTTDLTWGPPPPGVQNYQIFINDSPDTSSYIWETATAQTYWNYPPPVLIPGETYYAWVIGFDAGGYAIASSNVVTISIEIQPYNLSVDVNPNPALPVEYKVNLSDFSDLSHIIWSSQTSSQSLIYSGDSLEYSASSYDRTYYWNVEPAYGVGQLFNISFMWDNINGASKYSVRLNEGADTSGIIWEGIFLINSGNYPPGAPILQANTLYTLWTQALTEDNENYGPPSDPVSFMTPLLEQISLSTPANGERWESLTPAFGWSAPQLPEVSLVWSFKTPIFMPPVPLTPGNGNTVVSITPTFTWRMSTPAPKTRLRISANPNMAVPFYEIITNLTTHTYQANALPLQYQTTYYWRLTALDADDQPYSPTSVIFNFITPEAPAAPPPAPEPPPVVLAGPVLITPLGEVSSTRPNFIWNEVDGAAGYQIQLDDDQNFSSVLWDAQVGALSAVYNGENPLLFNLDYYWHVRALDSNGNPYSEFSSAGAFRVTNAFIVSLISPVNTEVSSRTPAFTWQSVDGAVKYGIWVYSNAELTDLVWTSSNIVNTTVNYPSQGVTPLIFGNTYYWQAAALNQAGVPLGDRSDAAYFTVTQELIPSLISPVNTEIENMNPTFSWNPVEGVDRYRLQIAANQNFSQIIFTNSDINTTTYLYTATNLQVNTTYYWRVASLAPDGKLLSEPSPSASFTTPEYSYGIELNFGP